MQKLMRWIESWTDRTQWTKLVDRVAARSQTAVWRRVYPKVSQMELHEACGYIRVRAAVVVRREMHLATAECPLDPKRQAYLHEMATHRIVRRALQELVRQQRQPVGRAA